MKPLVSVLIPAFNAQEWIAASIRSALRQTWPAIEVIVVDDGSTDATLEAAKRVGDPRVSVHAQQNAGAAAARNRALQAAQGDYIQWLDADDLLAPDKIEKQIGHFDRHGPLALLSSAWARFFYRYYKAQFQPGILWQNLTPAAWLQASMLHNGWMSIESWLVSRQLTERAGRWDTRLLRDNDGEYFARVLSHCTHVYFVPEAHSYARMANLQSISSEYNISQEKLKSMYLSLHARIEILLALDPGPTSRVAALSMLQRLYGYMQAGSPALVKCCEDLAASLGGELRPVRANLKRRTLQRVIGVRAATRLADGVSRCRFKLSRGFDKVLFDCDARRVTQPPRP